MKKKLNLEIKKSSQIFDILTKIIKETVDVFADFLSTSINSSIKFSLFPSCLKFADVTSLHKKRRKNAKQDYRSVSSSPTLKNLQKKQV